MPCSQPPAKLAIKEAITKALAEAIKAIHLPLVEANPKVASWLLSPISSTKMTKNILKNSKIIYFDTISLAVAVKG